MALFRCGGGGGSKIYFQNGGTCQDIATDGKPKRAILSLHYSGNSYLETEVYDENNAGAQGKSTSFYINGAAKSTKTIGQSGSIYASLDATGIKINSAVKSGASDFSYFVEV